MWPTVHCALLSFTKRFVNWCLAKLFISCMIYNCNFPDILTLQREEHRSQNTRFLGNPIFNCIAELWAPKRGHIYNSGVLLLRKKEILIFNPPTSQVKKRKTRWYFREGKQTSVVQVIEHLPRRDVNFAMNNKCEQRLAIILKVSWSPRIGIIIAVSLTILTSNSKT